MWRLSSSTPQHRDHAEQLPQSLTSTSPLLRCAQPYKNHHTIRDLCIMIADDGSCSDWEKFHAVSFFRVDAGELPQLSKHRGVTAMPTFQLYVGGDKVDEIKGSNQTALVGLIEAVL